MPRCDSAQLYSLTFHKETHSLILVERLEKKKVSLGVKVAQNFDLKSMSKLYQEWIEQKRRKVHYSRASGVWFFKRWNALL